jgi:hypothetical protein
LIKYDEEKLEDIFSRARECLIHLNQWTEIITQLGTDLKIWKKEQKRRSKINKIKKSDHEFFFK